MNVERVQYWMGQGAQVTDRVSRFLEAAGVIEAKTRNNPQKAVPGKKAQERAKKKQQKQLRRQKQPQKQKHLQQKKPRQRNKPST